MKTLIVPCLRPTTFQLKLEAVSFLIFLAWDLKEALRMNPRRQETACLGLGLGSSPQPLYAVVGIEPRTSCMPASIYHLSYILSSHDHFRTDKTIGWESKTNMEPFAEVIDEGDTGGRRVEVLLTPSHSLVQLYVFLAQAGRPSG